jgi:hypothetical protein
MTVCEPSRYFNVLPSENKKDGVLKSTLRVMNGPPMKLALRAKQHLDGRLLRSEATVHQGHAREPTCNITLPMVHANFQAAKARDISVKTSPSWTTITAPSLNTRSTSRTQEQQKPHDRACPTVSRSSQVSAVVRTFLYKLLHRGRGTRVPRVEMLHSSAIVRTTIM